RVFSLWKGPRPAYSRPWRLSGTYLPTTSTTSLRRTSSSLYSCGIIPVNFLASSCSRAGAPLHASQDVPPPGHIVFFKGADGKLVAHPADIVSDGPVVSLLLRDPLVEGG